MNRLMTRKCLDVVFLTQALPRVLWHRARPLALLVIHNDRFPEALGYGFLQQVVVRPIGRKRFSVCGGATCHHHSNSFPNSLTPSEDECPPSRRYWSSATERATRKSEKTRVVHPCARTRRSTFRSSTAAVAVICRRLFLLHK